MVLSCGRSAAVGHLVQSMILNVRLSQLILTITGVPFVLTTPIHSLHREPAESLPVQIDHVIHIGTNPTWLPLYPTVRCLTCLATLATTTTQVLSSTFHLQFRSFHQRLQKNNTSNNERLRHISSE